MEITTEIKLKLRWQRGLQFQIKTPSRNEVLLDGEQKQGISPMEALLGALCGCMATDVVTILQKMRADLKSLTVAASGARNAEPPRFFRKIELVFSVTGSVPAERVEHAIQLSFERYCSVFHSLRKDLEVTHRVEIQRE
ncbi:MAG TPA: OsmC family protein [Acidobacteriota bacterium]|jgi:putative redox protein